MSGSNERRISVVGLGEVGSALTKALLSAGYEVVGHDVDVDRATSYLQEAATHDGFRFADLDELAGTGRVISAVHPTTAVAVANGVVAGGDDAVSYLDLNSTGPAEKREIADLVAAKTGGSVTDATIGGGGFRLPQGPSFYLAGSDASAWRELLTGVGYASVHVLGSEAADVGQAAMLKMLRTAYTKGIEGMLVETLVVAHDAGLLDDVIDSIGASFDGLSFRRLSELLVRGHVPHAARRAGEIRMAMDTIAHGTPEARLPLLAGTLERYEIDAAHVAGRQGPLEPETLTEALDALSGAVRGRP